ncbi:hypothetical protein FUAX_18770 [Fulvitalea axinellae]|uniref:Tetratricopeptide repeat protein n=1 Tax=Fulvitalea axinellae TaxID=1182444 RepID=A0AAU9DET4_9BACT|nr:hypothetical protein FUAX_18770 [Fulvitalea axinellae]
MGVVKSIRVKIVVGIVFFLSLASRTFCEKGNNADGTRALWLADSAYNSIVGSEHKKKNKQRAYVAYDSLFNAIDSTLSFAVTIRPSTKDSLLMYGTYSLMARMVMDFYANRKDGYESNYEQTKKWLERRGASVQLKLRLEFLRGSFLMKQGRHKQALSIFQESTRLATNSSDTMYMGKGYYYVGRILSKESDFKKANESFRKAIDAYKTVGNQVGQSAVYNALALNHKDMKNLDSALFFYKKSLSYFPEVIGYQRATNKATLVNNIGNVFLEMNMPDSASRYVFQSNKTYKRLGNAIDILKSNNNLGKYYALKGNRKKAIETYESNLSIKPYQKAYDEILLVTMRELSDLYAKDKNYNTAYSYLDRHRQISDSVNRHKNLKEIENAVYEEELKTRDAKYALLGKEKELLDLEKLWVSKQRGWLLVLLILTIVFAVYVVLRQRGVIRRSNKILELERELSQNQIALKEVQRSELELRVNSQREEMEKFAYATNKQISLFNEFDEKISQLKTAEGYVRAQQLNSLQLWIRQSMTSLTKDEATGKKLSQLGEDYFVRLNRKYPDLNKNESELFGLFYLGLTNKEISVLLNTSAKSIEMKKYRLRKKTNISREVDFSEIDLG